MSLVSPVRVLLASFTVLLVAAIGAVGASASSGPEWRIDSLANSSLAPEGTLTFFIEAENVGDQPMDGSPITISVDLPAGLEAVPPVSMRDRSTNTFHTCSGTTSIVCTTNGPLPSRVFDGLDLKVKASASANGSLTAVISVTGGGAATVTTVDSTLVSPIAPVFGIAAFDSQTINESGGTDTRAGDHPFSTSASFDLNTMTNPNPILGEIWPVQAVKDIDTELSPGVVGDPGIVSRCTIPQLSHANVPSSFAALPLCPPTSQVGTALVRLKGIGGGIGNEVEGPLPVFNLVPPPGAPAEFGFNIYGSVIAFTANIRSSSDYGVTVKAVNIPEALQTAGSTVTFWGDPASPTHDAERACPGHEYPATIGEPVATDEEHCVLLNENGEPVEVNGKTVPAYKRPEQQAFLRNPTSCTASGEGLSTTLQVDSWQHPGVWVQASTVSHEAPGYPFPAGPSSFPSGYNGPTERGSILGIDECANVPFAPSFTAAPTNTQAASPSGLDVSVSMPQQGLTEPGAISETDLKTATVKLPVGVTINPAAANGQGACTSTQIGLSTPVGTLPAHFSETPVQCPDSSKLGTVEVESPLLVKYNEKGEPVNNENSPVGSGEHAADEVLHGAVYLAKQQDNPFASLLALYLVVEDEQSGIKLKLPGQVIANEQTGQLETVFDNNPQLPFEHLRLHLYGGEHAPLTTPDLCGEYTTQATLGPWSGNTPQQLASTFTISGGPGGSACPTPTFDPSLAAGTQNPTAAQTSPFVLHLTRNEGTQRFGAVDTTLPEGLSGYLSHVSRCSDQALAAISPAPGSGAGEQTSPSCPASSLLGSATVGVGSGSDPFYVDTGRVYLAGPYQGAPFSVAIVTPAVAGPFDLGSVVVRAGIYVDPNTARVTVKADPLPTIIQGIPLDIRSIEVRIDRTGFILNPTSCEPLSLETQVRSTGGILATPSERFQAADCEKLAFKPSFTVSTQGKTSRKQGASLDVKVSFPSSAQGEANIAKVKVSLPKQLPSRLDTLKLACVASVFQTNPSACPAASRVGTAVAHTPILTNPLSGPAYIVSHGGAAFPDLEIVLQGEGITVVLDGKTDINPKTNITTSTFETVPDVPVSSFELKLPEGTHSVLGAPGGKLCSTKLTMPTLITAQNNMILKQKTQIKVTGCPKQKHKKRAKHNTKTKGQR